MNHRYIRWEGESVRGRTSQGANEPEGEQAKGWISQAQRANKPGSERARGRMSQRVSEPRGERARGQKSKWGQQN